MSTMRIGRLPDSDRAALGKFFSSTGGRTRWAIGTNRWSKKDGWKSKKQVWDWEGVSTTWDGRVEKLILTYNGCAGSLPPDLQDLDALMELKLVGNCLTGLIPSELGAMLTLTVLDLSRNSFKGEIPSALGMLSSLTELNLSGNHLTGDIPPELGELSALRKLYLSNNSLTGVVPPEFGRLSLLTHLDLSENWLTGEIPPELGEIRFLQELILCNNCGSSGSYGLSGVIPSELGDLTALSILSLSVNKLTGDIPPELGKLSALVKLELHSNRLTGSVPAGLLDLSMVKLEHLDLWGNDLVGAPSFRESLAFLRARLLPFSQRVEPQYPSRHQQSVSINPQDTSFVFGREAQEAEAAASQPPDCAECLEAVADNASTKEIMEPAVDKEFTDSDSENKDESSHGQGYSPTVVKETVPESPRSMSEDGEERILSVSLGSELSNRQAEAPALQLSASSESDSPERLASGTSNEEPDTRPPTEETLSEFSPHLGEVYVGESFRAKVASCAELQELTREGEVTLDEIEILTAGGETPGASPGVKVSGMPKRDENLRELEKLAHMAKVLQEVASNKMEDADMQQREMSLVAGTFDEAYCTCIRSGLCSAYLAASVVDSNLVATSRVGTLGMAGKALNLVACVAPVVGGLTNLAATALQAGDRFVQTRRVCKIVDLATDVVECCSLARRVALRLTEGRKDDDSEVERQNGITPGSAGLERFGSAQGLSSWGDSTDDEAVLEWFTDEIVSEDLPGGESKNPFTKAGRRLGRKHLKMLLKAVGKDYLANTATLNEKVDVLVSVVLGEDVPKLPNVPKSPNVRPLQLWSKSEEYILEHAPAPPRLASNSIGSVSGLSEDGARSQMHPEDLVEQLENVKRSLKTLTNKLESQEESPRRRGDHKAGQPGCFLSAGGGQVYRQAQAREDVGDFLERSARAPYAGDRPMTEESFERRRREDQDVMVERLGWLEDRVESLEATEVSRTKHRKRGAFLSRR